jgi:thioredoxin 1
MRTYDESALAGKSVVDFYMDGCIPCKQIAPVLAQLEEEWTEIGFYRANAEYLLEAVEKYGILGAPTLLFLSDGEEQGRLVGVQSKQEIVAAIEELNRTAPLGKRQEGGLT